MLIVKLDAARCSEISDNKVATSKVSGILTLSQMSSVFVWLNLVRYHSLCTILYPKRRIESYSLMGIIVSPSKILIR